jgi:FixJ family two-component response regulator
MRVALVEDDESLRRGLLFQLRTAGFEVSSYSSGEDFFKKADAPDFDCIVADIFLPKMNGLQLQERLTRALPFVSIVFITGHGDLSIGMQAMRSGAVDFLEKPVDDEALIRSVTKGVQLTNKRRTEHARRVELEMRVATLTPREREVFALITTGLLNKQVGTQLGTTERTVKAHRERVMDKMGAESLADLVRMAGFLGLHSPRA